MLSVYQKSKKVFVAMSGGVDSSVAALLLKRQRYDVTGVFMRCYNLDGCAERDAEDARRVAGRLGIPFYVWDFEKEYKREVVKYMIDGYRKGITPNPDVMCNREIKFGLFLKRALTMGAEYVATGHYVRLRLTGTRNKPSSQARAGGEQGTGERNPMFHVPCSMSLFVARDNNKDQSYFLWTLTQNHLRHCLFPIGGYLKSEVRAIARRAGLPTADKKDSQGICFLGKFSLKDFLKRRIPSERGDVVTTEGVRVGAHDGAAFYTIGQRHGLALSDKPSSRAQAEGRHATRKKEGIKPFYVAEKDMKTNTLVVAEGKDNPALYKQEIVLAEVNFMCDGLEVGNRKLEIPVFARVRYRQPLARAMLCAGTGNEKQLSLIFARPQKFVAPGQSAVFYARKGEMLGGGVIVKAE